MSQTIVLTGGGSGGHITPLLAVAETIKKKQPDCRIIYIGQRGDKLGDIPAANPAIEEVYTVRAGKFRRYHGEGWRQLLDIPEMLRNVRDFFFVISGLFQSRHLLKRLQPDVIFVKGGFVGVPVGLAAAWLKIPYITHDSDAIPGLANRIISRWAKLHAVAMPAEVYNYPQARTVTTGIPLRAEFQPVSSSLKQKYRQKIKIPDEANLLFVIGGGLGAQRVNRAVAQAMPHLLQEFSNLHLVHVTGRANHQEVSQQYEQLSAEEQGRVKVFDYLDDVATYSGAADLIITRAGATNLAEFAVQGKACIVLPSSFLAAGHQLKNAEYLAQRRAAEVLQEDDLAADPNRLAKRVSALLNDPATLESLGKQLNQLAKPDASRHLAELIINTGDSSKG